MVAAPAEIKLWFTEAPQDGSTQIRLLTSDGTLVPTNETALLPDEAAAFTAGVEGSLVPGRYTVAWRAIARDGHPTNAEFTFSVRADD
jgi:methionine-rich copper-binding protein CopC